MVTIDPRMYREVLLISLVRRCPTVEARLAEPGALDAQVASFEPHVVVCAEATPKVRETATSWVEVATPRSGMNAQVCVGSRCSRIEDVTVEDLVAIIDETEGLIYSTKD